MLESNLQSAEWVRFFLIAILELVDNRSLNDRDSSERLALDSNTCFIRKYGTYANEMFRFTGTLISCTNTVIMFLPSLLFILVAYTTA